jgi:hypothetical protein
LPDPDGDRIRNPARVMDNISCASLSEALLLIVMLLLSLNCLLILGDLNNLQTVMGPDYLNMLTTMQQIQVQLHLDPDP